MRTGWRTSVNWTPTEGQGPVAGDMATLAMDLIRSDSALVRWRGTCRFASSSVDATGVATSASLSLPDAPFFFSLLTVPFRLPLFFFLGGICAAGAAARRRPMQQRDDDCDCQRPARRLRGTRGLAPDTTRVLHHAISYSRRREWGVQGSRWSRGEVTLVPADETTFDEATQ